MREWMEEQLKQKYYKFSDLYSEACEKFPKGAETLTLETARSSMKRWRLNYFPPNPSSIAQLSEQLIEQKYSTILKSSTAELSAITITDDDECLHIIFYDKEFLQQFFCKTTHCFIDGTFQCRPNIQDCMQLLNVLAIRAGVVVVIFMCIMSRRTETAYVSIFKEMKNVLEFSELKIVMSDFELPLRSAIKQEFPQAKSVGCNIHFDRALYAKLKPLSKDIKENETLSFLIKRITALAFLPSNMIEEAYYSIKAEAEMTADIGQKLQDFFKYFERFWLKIVKPEGFSIFGLSKRTNNCAEAFHAQLIHKLEKRPPTCAFIFRVLKLIIKTKLIINQSLNGKNTNRLPRYQTQYKSSEIQRAWNRLLHCDGDYNVDDFLTTIANLKGDLSEKLSQYIEDRLTNKFELDNNPETNILDEDVDFESTILLNPSIQRINMQLQRLRKKQDLRNQERLQEPEEEHPNSSINDYSSPSTSQYTTLQSLSSNDKPAMFQSRKKNTGIKILKVCPVNFPITANFPVRYKIGGNSENEVTSSNIEPSSSIQENEEALSEIVCTPEIVPDDMNRSNDSECNASIENLLPSSYQTETNIKMQYIKEIEDKINKRTNKSDSESVSDSDDDDVQPVQSNESMQEFNCESRAKTQSESKSIENIYNESITKNDSESFSDSEEDLPPAKINCRSSVPDSHDYDVPPVESNASMQELNSELRAKSKSETKSIGNIDNESMIKSDSKNSEEYLPASTRNSQSIQGKSQSRCSSDLNVDNLTKPYKNSRNRRKNPSRRLNDKRRESGQSSNDMASRSSKKKRKRRPKKEKKIVSGMNSEI